MKVYHCIARVLQDKEEDNHPKKQRENIYLHFSSKQTSEQANKQV
jgi:hypothetical protein